MSVNDYGIEVLKKAAVQLSPGEYALRGVGTGTGGASAASLGRTPVGIFRHDYQAVAVTTAAYTELVSATTEDVNELFVFDSSGRTLILALGAIGFEADKVYVIPGGNGTIPWAIPSGSRISIKAVGTNATKGEINATLWK